MENQKKQCTFTVFKKNKSINYKNLKIMAATNWTIIKRNKATKPFFNSLQNNKKLKKTANYIDTFIFLWYICLFFRVHAHLS